MRATRASSAGNLRSFCGPCFCSTVPPIRGCKRRKTRAMLRLRPWLATGCAILAIAWVSIGAQAAVKSKSLGDLLARDGTLAEVDNPLPNRVEFPGQFVREVDVSQGVAITLVGMPQDVQRVIAEKSFGNITQGVFSFAVSLDVEYDPQRKLFSGEDDPQTEQSLRDAGFTNIRVSRASPLQVATLELTAEGNGRGVFLLYVALADTGSVFRVSYHAPKVAGKEDVEVWRRFVRGLEERA
jgi:hypothetical protein